MQPTLTNVSTLFTTVATDATAVATATSDTTGVAAQNAVTTLQADLNTAIALLNQYVQGLLENGTAENDTLAQIDAAADLSN